MTPRERNLEEALAECLRRLEAGEEIESCLRDQGPQAERLRPLLEAALSLRQLPLEPYSPQSREAGRAKLHAALNARRAERAGLPGWALLKRPAVALATAAALAAIAFLILGTDLFRPGATPTHARITGVLSAAQQDAIVVHTQEGPLNIGLRETTRVVDPQGQPVQVDQIPPGSSVKVEAERSNGDLTAVEVEVEEDEEEKEGGSLPRVEVEFTGTITSLDGSTLSLAAPFGPATVLLRPDTEIKGALAIGTSVKVHAIREADGSYVAEEIEVLAGPSRGGEEEEKKRDEDHSEERRDERFDEEAIEPSATPASSEVTPAPTPTETPEHEGANNEEEHEGDH